MRPREDLADGCCAVMSGCTLFIRWYYDVRKPSNGGVDAAARIQSSIAGPIILRNTLPPLASNDLLYGRPQVVQVAPVEPTDRSVQGKFKRWIRDLTLEIFSDERVKDKTVFFVSVEFDAAVVAVNDQKLRHI